MERLAWFRMKKIYLLILFLVPLTVASSQEEIISESSVQQRKSIIQQSPGDPEKEFAEEFARENRIPVRRVFDDGRVIEIRRISQFGQPVYLTTHNINAARTTSTDKVWQNGGLGLGLGGGGIVVGVWDGGPVRRTHTEFEGRTRIIDNDTDPIFHATHVAGTIGAAGLRSEARGMANKTTIDSYTWEEDNVEMRSAAENGMLISNHSYGYIHGWNFDEEKERWEWHGTESISKQEDYNFGFYSEDSRRWDAIAYDNPKYLIVKSAGNDRGEGPAPGAEHFVWSGNGWVKSTEVRQRDGNGGYDCIGTRATSKNILTVGAVEDIPMGYNQPSDVKISSFSVFGPTDDGRIKPDIVGNGTSLLSAGSASDVAYGSSTGTSMSAPNISGSLALIQEHYRNLNGTYMLSSLLKALVLHTADDAGNAGPDYQYGWGLMNTAKAVKHISDSKGEMLLVDTLLTGDNNIYTLYSTGEEDVRITIAWTDPPGKVPAPQLNPTDRILVNDLDIRLRRVIDGHQFRPFTLDPANPAKLAVSGDNKLDNVEQILLKNPLPGYYTLTVSGKGSLESGKQVYGLALAGVMKEFVASGTIKKEAVNGDVVLTSAGSYLNNMDVEWQIEPENNLPVSFYFDYFSTEPDKDFVRIYDGIDDAAPLLAEFSGTLVNPDTVIIAASGQMKVVFMSDGSTTDKGFRGRYCTVAPEGSLSILGEEFPCRETLTHYFAVAGEGTEFTWESLNHWSYNETSFNGIEIQIGDTLDTLRVIPFNRCGTGQTAEQIITPLSEPPTLTSITGDTVVCAGVPVEFSTSVSKGAAYAWEVPQSWLGFSETFSITLVPDKISGQVVVTGSNACGAGRPLQLQVDLLNVPGTENIFTDRVPPCEGSVQPFYIDALPNHTYQWSVNDDWEIVEGMESDTALVKVGSSANFINVLTKNKCGERESGRLMLTAKLPELPLVEVVEDNSGFTLLDATNRDNYAGLQWYRNGVEVMGDAGRQNPLIVSKNGLYTAASISDKECYNVLQEDAGILIEEDRFTFVSYRKNETTVVIENSMGTEAEVRLYSIFGRLEYFGKVQSGYNEVSFAGNGVYLLRFSGYGSKHVIKAAF
jgi:subtilisin family serine protease